MLEQQGGLCAICGQPFVTVGRSLSQRPYRRAMRPTFDHITPRAWGGDDVPTNLRMAHAICNEYRASEEHLYSLQALERGKKTANCVAYLLKDRIRRQREREAKPPLRVTFEPPS